MRLFILTFTFCAISIFCFSQETNKVAPSINDSFTVIISILDNNSDVVLQSIKNVIGNPESGLRYIAYCTNQKCVVLNASSYKYGLALGVLKYLETKINTVSIDYKKVTIADFYKTCTFSGPEEYRYFKLNYH